MTHEQTEIYVVPDGGNRSGYPRWASMKAISCLSDYLRNRPAGHLLALGRCPSFWPMMARRLERLSFPSRERLSAEIDLAFREKSQVEQPPTPCAVRTKFQESFKTGIVAPPATPQKQGPR